MPVPGKTIDFVIIGAAKAGTTSLASWLGKHPDVCMSQPKETMFFGSPKLFDQGINYFHSKFFSHYQGEALLGDATPAYSNRDRHPGTPERVHAVNPAAKIIYIVRHPLKKVESSWQMHTNFSSEIVKTPENRLYAKKASEGFQAYVQDSALFDHFVEVCSYQYQLAAWENCFPSDQIYVMFLEDLASRRDVELMKLSNFLGLTPDHLLSGQLNAENTFKERRKLHWFVHYVGKLQVQKLLSESMKMRLSRSPLLSYPQSVILKPRWLKNYSNTVHKCHQARHSSVSECTRQERIFLLI